MVYRDFDKAGLGFGFISVLRPFNTFKIILGAVSYPNTLFLGKPPRQFIRT